MSATSPRQQSERTSRNRGRVLLITDDITAMPKESLAAAGLEIVGVSGVAAALVSLQKSRPHVVVASTAAKGISTRELFRALTQSRKGLPLIVVGPKPATHKRRYLALESGAFDYIQLPAEEDLLVLRVRQLVAMTLEQDRLRAEADLDSLTGLANRRRFRAALNNELERWRRYRVPCALLLLDIDHMKAINDRYGHPVGDLVIREIANTLAEVSRDNDTAARLGGEEFALLLAGIKPDKATLAAERLRSVLADLEIPDVGHITVSIGVAACPAHATSERMLYGASDRALYVAKNEGRNRVSVAPLLQESLPGVE